MEKIVVAGAGTMGAGIAFVAARAGFEVELIDLDPLALDRARAAIAKDAERAGMPDAASRVNYYGAIPTVSGAQIGIEAVPERLDLKQGIFAELSRALPRSALLATNTSSLSVSEIADAVQSPERVVGLHFFNPPARMQLVEIVRGEQTADETVQRARAFAERLGKTFVLAADTPGFIVNRVARPFYLQAMRAYEAGVAPMDELDRLARGAGFRMGPFELMDAIGLDVNLATSQSVFERTGAPRLEPVNLQRELVAQHRLGRKTGAGFYDYTHGLPARDDGPPQVPEETNADERVAVIGSSGLAAEMAERLRKHYANVAVLENEDALDEIALGTTIVFDVGDGAGNRAPIVETLDADLPEETIIFVDAYATDVEALAKRVKYPHRIVGYGILSSLESQSVVEIVDTEQTSDDALELAQELFQSAGARVALVENHAGLFLGRTIGSIVNEAVYAVEQGIASADDVDLAMRLGTNYPRGPIEWGRQIGGDRIVRILQRLASAEGAAFAPHRALWVLDAQEEERVFDTAAAEGAIE